MPNQKGSIKKATNPTPALTNSRFMKKAKKWQKPQSEKELELSKRRCNLVNYADSKEKDQKESIDLENRTNRG